MDASWLLSGIDDLVATRPQALAVFEGTWRPALAREALNQEVLAQALLAVLAECHPSGPVVIRGVSPITEILCRGLLDAGRVVTLALAGYRTGAQKIFDVPVVQQETVAGQGATLDASVAVPADYCDGDVGAARGAVPALGLRDERVRARYRQFLNAHRETLREQLDAIVQAPGEHVLFVSQKSYYNQLRTSTALRRRGFRSCALVMDPNLRGHQQGYFDELISTDLLSFILWLQGASRALLHTQGWLFRYHLPVLIDAFLGAGCTQCVELMDLNSFLFPSQALEQTLPHMRVAWGPDVAAEQALQVRCEQYLGRHAAGLLYPGSERHLDALGLRALGREQHYLEFLSYPLAEFCVAPKGVAAASAEHRTSDAELPRLVFAGGIVPVDERRRPELFGDAQWVTTAELILQQGLTLHVYNNPLHAPPETYAHRYAAHLELEQRFPRYRFARGALPWDVGALLAPYDLGLIVYDYSGVLFGEEHFLNIIPAKLFMYLEAGLPVLVSRRAQATCRFVETHGCGVGVDGAELANLPELLRGLDLPTLRAGVARVQARFSMDSQVERLIALYRRVSGPPAAFKSAVSRSMAATTRAASTTCPKRSAE